MAVLLAAAMLVNQVLVPFDPGDPYAPVPVPIAAEPDPTPMTPYAYLYATYPRLARRMDCVISHESEWDAGAVNRRSGAAGLAQFLLSTWVTTPPGAAGLSRFDPIANIDGAAWLATNSGWQHWQVVLRGYC